MPRPTLTPLALAAALCAAHGAALAQTDAPKTKADDGLSLETIVVTGTSGGTTKMKSSISISTIEEGVVTATAGSATEVLRAIPGLRSESSGGESNANVGVRGIPISAGGARYIQFQEDGLPVLQFGDIAFATPDTWIRVDNGLDRLEVLRGGSASTLATGGPGGIINYISKSGLEKGGAVQFSKGIGHDLNRVDADYGGRIAPKTRFWVGGYYRTGDGGRNGADDTEKGGQIRANVTQELPGGYARLSFKYLDDHTPTFLPTPVRYVNGNIQAIPGLDPRTTAFYSANFPRDRTLTKDNDIKLVDIGDGLSAKATAVGFELDLDVGAGFRLQNNFRWAKNSGRFVGIFPGSDVTAAPAGTTVAGSGGVYTGNQFTAVVFDTKVDDVGLLANDVKLSRSFAVGGGDLKATGGLYLSRQKLDLTWNFNQFSLTADEDHAQLLNVPNVINNTPGFGGCCMNTQESRYKTAAPYAIIGYERGPFTADASVRRDENKASGSFNQSQSGLFYSPATVRDIDYDFGHTSYSFGGNFRVTSDVALFARYSKGAAYNADRITFFNDPRIANGDAGTVPINEVKQLEGGVKYRIAGVNVFATLFHAKTDEINVDPTTSPVAVTTNKYKSRGAELEVGWRNAWVGITGGATYTDADVDASSNAALVGRAPKRQARWVYQLVPTVTIGDRATLGASIVGTSKSQDDSPAGPLTVKLGGYATVNAFASVNVWDGISVIAAVNNVFDKVGYTESNDGRGAARSVNGRTAKVSLKYAF